MGDSLPVKTSALAIVPEVTAWPAIQALRLAHDKQVRIWPPHVNILYPFVPERDFEAAAHLLAGALSSIGPLKLRFSRKGRFGSTAFLLPECDEDPNLARLYEACKAVFPNLPQPHDSFQPHLTIGQFKGEAECRAFLESCPFLGIETEVSSLCLLARDSMQHPFRTPFRVKLGMKGEIAVEEGGAQAYVVHRDGPVEDKACLSAEGMSRNFFQLDEEFVRFVFTARHEAVKEHSNSSGAFQARSTLFVVDQSGSMGRAYNQVKIAVKYMTEQCCVDNHEIGFVLYNHEAKLASAEEVLGTSATGTTSFSAAFKMATKYIDSLQAGRAVTVVFMTDGQDTASKDLPQAQLDFGHFLQTCGRPTTLHAIGFTSGHNRNFLEELRCMGSFEGMYRYAEEGESLEQRFAEMFDFADINLKVKLQICDQEILTDAHDSGDGVSFDIVLPRTQFAMYAFEKHSACTVIFESGDQVSLQQLEVDPLFTIRCVDETAINSQQDLDQAQDTLSKVQVHKASKSQREQASDARREAQARLDKYHQLFATGARNDLVAAGGNLAAELSSLRHEATFSKARRARTMAQRATANASMAQIMEKLLNALPQATSAELETLEANQLTCTLSGETPQDALRDSRRDFFVFSLRVRRPEDVIDAPTVIDVMQFLSGTYSNEAFRMGAEFALRSAGPEQAHGGFAGSTKHPIALGEDVGLFRGPDGQFMNACLPLYLSEAHFARVKVQIKPILGYFFTLDPLGYKGDQIIALFQILGLMLCARFGSGPAGESGFSGIWADWLIGDFTKLCRGLKPLAMEYLADGGYTGTPRGDLVDEFLESPSGRTKERLPALGVLIGWAAASAIEITPRFHMAFTEELWRRNFTALYKGQPREPIIEVLEKLLYGPGDSNGDGEENHFDSIALTKNKANKEKQFILWARYRRGDLPKKQADEIKKQYGTVGPEVEGLTSTCAEYKPRRLRAYDEAPGFFDSVVETELKKISRQNSFAAEIYDGRPWGKGFSCSEQRLMLIQALQFVGNIVVNEAVTKGSYMDTFTCLAEGSSACICEHLHESFEKHRREKLSSVIEKRNALLTAQRIMATEDLDAFAGRLAVSCPIRGGEVFNNVVALLVSCSGDASERKVPHLKEKATALLTGKIGDHSILAEGSSWIHCPFETARRIQEVVGDDAFSEIELQMYGTWGHVYRPSDIPNRHGHCVSQPNPDLTRCFKGFHLGFNSYAATMGA